ncbi:MAG: putative branched-chain amino acid transport ATP-binding protein LivG [Methanocella sp. PtaU1.Bin125]|nr:MAG: putative branched-chain amino acid transport ATP-binding protein LivG [Methanocella sp. PtaU1.Bin125]
MKAIETRDLTRRFGRIEAVNSLDLNVEEGVIYGFLGPNGAGKSTTINMLMGFVKPHGGTAKVLGHDIRTGHYEIRKLVGYLPERPPFYESMSGVANAKYFGRLIGVKDLDARVDALLKQVGLEGRGQDKVRGYSHGMRQRLGIAIALLGDPKLLIMDEPTTGLDPQGSHDIREIIRRLKDRHVTVFLSSHILHEVQEVSDVVGIIKGGRMLVEQPIDTFLKSTRGGATTFEFYAPGLDDAYADIAQKINGVESASVRDGRLYLAVAEPSVAEDVNAALVGAGLRVREIRETMPTLEDAFLKVVGERKEG